MSAHEVALHKNYIKISIDDVQLPKQGYEVIVNGWWPVIDGCVLGYKVYGPKSQLTPTPMYNHDKRVAEIVSNRLQGFNSAELVNLPVVYWPSRNH